MLLTPYPSLMLDDAPLSGTEMSKFAVQMHCSFVS